MTLSNTLTSIQHELTRYVYSIYLLFGIIGCCLNILLLSRKQFRTISCCLYFIPVSATMLINMIFGIVVQIHALNYVDLTTSLVWFCKMRVYILQVSSMIYRWLLVAACFDRYALSSSNTQRRNFAKVTIAHRVIVGVICIWLILPIHGPILYGITMGRCGIYNNQIGAFYHSIFTTIFGCILPVLMMVIFIILLYRNLLHKQQQRHQIVVQRQTNNSNELTRSQSKRDRQVFLMLLIQVFVYIICITPLMATNLYNAITLNLNKSPDRIAIEIFSSYLAEMFIYFFSVISFYLYTLVSKMFRNELKRLLHSILPCGWNNLRRVVPTTSNIPLRTI